MKQSIDRDQWLELSEESQEKALEWLKDKSENHFTIGLMIEFLYENVNDRISVAISKKNGSYISKDNFMMSSDFKDELADSLWEAVKRGTK